MKPYKRPYGGTPGPPVMYEKPSDPEDEGAGYGYSNAEGLEENDIYFYHSDHLGSTSYITDKDGNATQFVCYKPYGEALVDEHNTSYEQPWKFNGKELDTETGLYYYGARYYEPVLALWYGVDALAEKYPNMGGYVYCNNNPIAIIDLDGNDGVRIIDSESQTITIKADYYVVTKAVNYKKDGKIKELEGYSTKDIERMNKYNDYLNDLDLKISEGEYKGYAVKFDLQFIEGGSSLDSYISAQKDNYEEYCIGNTIQKGNQYTHKNVGFESVDLPDGMTKMVGGVTDIDKAAIVMNAAADNKMNRIHEIFHTFGFSHPKGIGGKQGIMKYTPSKPSKDDANELLSVPNLKTIIK